MENFHNHPGKPHDPFGRMIPDDGSQDRFRNMPDIIEIEASIGPSDDNIPDDVAKVEIMLDHAGLLNLRETEGPTGFYGERLRQAIVEFQRLAGLTETGRIAPGDQTHMNLRQRVRNAQQQVPVNNSSPAQQNAG